MKNGYKTALILTSLSCVGIVYLGLSRSLSSEPGSLTQNQTIQGQSKINNVPNLEVDDIPKSQFAVSKTSPEEGNTVLNDELEIKSDEDNTLDSDTKLELNNDDHLGDLVDIEADLSAPKHIDLWSLEDYEEVEIDSIPAIQTAIPLASIQQFNVGQSLSFDLPSNVGTIDATLINAINPLPGVKVWEGEMDMAGSKGNVIISQGQIETQFTITTPTTVYTASVDNETGRTVIIDEAEYAARTLPIDDTAKLDPSELIPLP